MDNNAKEHISNTQIPAKEDADLLMLFIKGDKEAFADIYNKYVDDLFSYGISLGFDRETVKDAIQDSFFKFYTNRKQLKGVNQLKFYLLRMLKNRLLDIYKSGSKNSTLETLELSFLQDTSIRDELIAHEEKTSLQQKVNNLLQSLTDRQREAVYLRFIQELEYEEVGSLLKMTVPATRKLISRAIKRMRD